MSRKSGKRLSAVFMHLPMEEQLLHDQKQLTDWRSADDGMFVHVFIFASSHFWSASFRVGVLVSNADVVDHCLRALQIGVRQRA